MCGCSLLPRAGFFVRVPTITGGLKSPSQRKQSADISIGSVHSGACTRCVGDNDIIENLGAQYPSDDRTPNRKTQPKFQKCRLVRVQCVRIYFLASRFDEIKPTNL